MLSSADQPLEKIEASVLTPATWEQNKGKLQSTPTGLLNLVGWFGSTHTAASWRKNPAFLQVFVDQQVFGFDPQTVDWGFSYVAIEAQVLSNASVILIRLENKELQNGSLGSIAEIGLALTSAALRGQAVVVSIEENLITSLREPGAIAQYMIIETFLEDWAESPEMAGLLYIHRGDELNQLAELACQVARQQMEAGHQTRIDFESVLAKNTQRKKHTPYRVLIGGSGGPYTAAYDNIFQKKTTHLAAPHRAQGHMVKILSEGAIAKAWSVPYGNHVDPMAVGLATRALLEIESEFKQEADLLLIPIMAEAASKAAATEIGLLLLSVLTTGQDIKIYMEPFDPIDYIRQQLVHIDITTCKTEKEVRQALHQIGVSDAILALTQRDDIGRAYKIFHAVQTRGQVAFKDVKLSLLGKTEIFTAADNINRVRALVKAHLEELHADPRFPNFFSYATRIEV